MEYNKAAADLRPGDQIEGFYVLNDIQLKRSSAGKPFLSGVICDATGSASVKMWDYSGPLTEQDSGKVIKLRGEVSEFKGTTQVTIGRLRLATEQDSYNLSELVATAPIHVEETLQSIRNTIASMEDADYRLICEKMLERHLQAFCTIPAAKSVHHSFRAGLLMHTSRMLQMADFLAKQYEEVIDRSLLLAGTLLHDFAKEREFKFSALGLVTEYSVAGTLLGHLVMGAQEVAELAGQLHIPEEKSMLLQHLLLSHHGQPEYGAAVVPVCAESELLSLIDNVDSRMEIYAEAYANIQPGSFSQRIFALEKKVYKHR